MDASAQAGVVGAAPVAGQDYSVITLERRGDVAILILSRPERMNAVLPVMLQEMDRALDECADARCLVITGAGRAFCAGADLTARKSLTPPGMTAGEAARERLEKLYNPLFTRISRMSIPVITAVNGPAVGVGCSLALLGDLVVAAEDAYFLLAFVNVGLVPDGGASWMLPRLIGKARAMEMMMLGERVPAEKAVDWGLIHRAVPGDMLMDTAVELAQRLAAGPTMALGRIRQLVADGLDRDFAQSLAAEAVFQHQVGDSADAEEAVVAFAERRKPKFVGR